ncbi:MAG: transglycosylase SLT domain-containing protein [Prevotellaceae bacterium]|jgi:membrane-bound lytic murein transglycosylase F|nr:transglycosylase SLT domain-containing protein [Prevotellaceae bacterium]
MKNAVFILSLILLIACKPQVYEQNTPDDVAQIYARGELRVITIESAISYYTSGDEQMGFDYDLAQNFADYMDLPLKIVVANSVDEVKQLLLNGEGDFAAYQMPCTKQNQRLFNVTDVTSLSNIVLVQPKDRQQITDVTELVGKEIYANDSKYLQRLHHLNEEIGGGIIIKQLPDSLNIDQIMYEVSAHNLPLTIADNDVAELGKFYFKNLDCSIPAGLPQQKSWLVRKNATQLTDSINSWHAKIENSRFFKKMQSQYLQKNSYYANFEIAIPKGSVSPYDSVFKAVAPVVGWDWRLLAAVAWNESHFNPDVVSSAGAMGVMQLMPRTGAKFGLNDSTFFEPKDNIRAGTEYIAAVKKMFYFIENSDERTKFVLAAYNAGQGHIFDAIALAKKYGANPHIWNQNVEKYLLLKSESEYYNDEVCKLGYFRASHTVRYVNDVMKTYDRYMGNSKK